MINISHWIAFAEKRQYYVIGWAHTQDDLWLAVQKVHVCIKVY